MLKLCLMKLNIIQKKPCYTDYHYEGITKAPGMFSGLLQQPHDKGTSEELGIEIASNTLGHTCHLLMRG